MGVVSYEFETQAAVAPARLYKAMASDFHNLLPKIVDSIESVETIEGTGAAGTIRKVILVEGGKSRYVLHKIDAIDESKCLYNYSIVGGSDLPELWEKLSFESIFVEGPNGGSIRKSTVKYFTKGDDAEITEDMLKSNQTRAEALVKFLEAYLLANPDYN